MKSTSHAAKGWRLVLGVHEGEQRTADLRAMGSSGKWQSGQQAWVFSLRGQRGKVVECHCTLAGRPRTGTLLATFLVDGEGESGAKSGKSSLFYLGPPPARPGQRQNFRLRHQFRLPQPSASQSSIKHTRSSSSHQLLQDWYSGFLV